MGRPKAANRPRRVRIPRNKANTVVEQAPTELAPEQVELTPEQIISVLAQQVGTARAAFHKLAQARAADRVRFNELTWDQGSEYINAETAGLDQQLGSVVPQ
jgi:hypothetical protein